MKRRFATTRSLFPEEAVRGAENPWFTKPGAKASGPRDKKCGLTTLELCAGAGGQALGYEQAGIEHAALVDIDKHACNTLRLNRPQWNVIEQSLHDFEGSAFLGVDIVSGGLPCPPLMGKAMVQGMTLND
jgi:methylase of polypeptide subunit release factors